MTATPTEVGSWSGLAVAISHDRVVIGPKAAALLLTLVAHTERLGRRDGIGLSPQLSLSRTNRVALSSALRSRT